MNILDALRDRQLFGPFMGPESWSAWSTFLAALFGLPMDAADLARFRQCTGRSAAPSAPVREAWVVAGRRGGKSRVAAMVAVYLACFKQYTLAPGELGTVQVIAADRAQALVVLRYVRALLDGVALLRPLVLRRSRECIELTNGIAIEVVSCTIRAPRGRTVVAAILDEVAFWWSDESAANPDAEVVAAIRPAMATVPDALLLGISSPYARKGLLYDMHRRHFGVEDPRVLVWQAATEVMNPTIDRAIIAEAYERDPSSARAEYGAEFRDDVEAFLSHEQVRAVVAIGCEELPPNPRHQYVAFVDPAGGSGADAMTLAIAHDEGGRVVLDAVRHVPPPFSPARVVAELAVLLKRYRLHVVTGDRFAAAWCTERFQAHGIHYAPTPYTRSQLYLAFAPMVLSEEVTLLDHPRLTRELASLERRPSRVGRDVVDHAPRAHDDLANAVAGAAVMVREARRFEPDLREAVGI